MSTFAAGDSTGTGYLALPTSGQGPGVLVLHAWWGLTQTFKDVCDRLAAMGFVAFAPDLFEGATATTIDEAQALVDNNDGARTHAITVGALSYLRQHEATQGNNIAALGFSFGAAWAIELASFRPEEIAAAVLFYGTYDADFAASRAAYLGHFAEEDSWEPAEGVQQLEEALRTAGREVSFYKYPDTSHWFFEPNRPEYDQDAAELAWQRTLAFLGKQLQA